MGRKLKLFGCIAVLLLLTACASAEAEELVEYHNNYVDEVNSKIEEINTLNQQSLSAASFQEAYEIQESELLPLVNEIKTYIDEQAPESELVKEYHALRKDQLHTWHEAFQMKFEVLGQMAEESISEAEANEIIMEADNKFIEAGEKAQEADQRMQELAEEHNLELE